MNYRALPISASLTALAFAQFSGSACAAETFATINSDTAAEESDAAQDTDGLVDIVVTATKRETNLQDTPIAISVVNSEDIKKRHIQSLIDLGDGAIPSLRVATFEARQSALTIGMRGIVPLDANQPAREQGVGVYIDGVYLGRQHGLNAGLLDVERIEVLKGPQGTLFGRNTEGGAVNIISKMPTGEFGGRASIGVGNFGSYSGSTHVDFPEIANIAFKVDAAIQHQNPTVKNPLPGQAGWNQFHRYGGRIAARWRPADGFTADLAFDIGRDENTPFYSQLLNYNPLGLTVLPISQPSGSIPSGTIRALPPIVTVSSERSDVADIGVPQQVSVGKTHGFMANLRLNVSDAIELRSITAFRSVKDDQWDNSGGAHRSPVFVTNGNFSRYSLAQLKQRQFSQELQAVGSFGSVDYVLGLYYFYERAEDAAATPNTNRWNADGTNYTINDPANTIPANRVVDRASRAFAKSYAGYGQATWTPAGLDAFHLTVGGRYTHDEKNGNLLKVNNVVSTLTFNEKSNRFDPMVTLAVDASDAVNLYAKYATGYRAGGASSRSLIYRSFGPEQVKSYEVGAKTEFFDRKVRLNLAGYMMDRTDSQVDFNFFDPLTNRNTLETVNAPGTTKIRGVEADLTLYPFDGLSLNASYAYTFTKVPPTPNPLVTGNPLQPVFIVFTPRNALSGSLDYAVPLGSSDLKVKLHMDANYSQATQTFDNEAVKNESSFIVNSRLALTDIKLNDSGTSLTLSAWARNLFDEAHIYRRSNANRRILGDYGNFNAPRTFGVEATIAF
jgi:iron complex outermembrane receptor protein